jgi:hypothetical protein
MPRSGERVWKRRARKSLERGGVSPEGASSPRARRSFISAVPCPSSEVEFRSRGQGAAGAARSVGPYRWAVIVSGVFYVCEFVCVLLFAKESGFFPGCLGDPYSCP